MDIVQIVDKMMENNAAIIEKKYNKVFEFSRDTVLVKDFIYCSQGNNWNTKFCFQFWKKNSTNKIIFKEKSMYPFIPLVLIMGCNSSVPMPTKRKISSIS
jgi:hypothetical protein